MDINAFQPNGATVNAAVTGTSAALALTGVGSGANVVLTNIGNQTAFITFGTSAATATAAAGHPLLANTSQTFTVSSLVTHVAHIAATTGSTLYATTGQGI